MFGAAINEQVRRPSQVRWFADAEILFQCHRHWDAVVAIIEHPGDFAPALRESLRNILHDDELRWELALINDVATPLVLQARGR